MLRECTSSRYGVNKSRMIRLANYSRDQLDTLRNATGIGYDECSRGTLQLFRNSQQMDGIAKDIALLIADGIPYEVLDRAGCELVEPGLVDSKAKIAGGLRLPGDETGDCFKFTNALADLAKSRGVRFLFGQDVRQLRHEQGRITAAVTDQDVICADAYVVALGSYSPALVRGLGLKLPVYPVKGYSITAAIVRLERAPVSTVLDETYKVAITRLGDRMRIGGMAEISGFSDDLPAARRATLEKSVSTLFTGAGSLADATFWSGLRPMTPDGTPIVGPTAIPNLYLNTGHGTLGWTMACGSARVIADIVSGCRTGIDAADLSLSRY